MVSFSPEITLLLAGIAGVAVLAVLGTLANLIRNATALHELTVSAAALRIAYSKQMAGEEEQEVIVVGEAVETPPTSPTGAV